MAVTADRVVVELLAKIDGFSPRIAGAERQFDTSMKRIEGSGTRTSLAVARTMATLAAGIGLVGAAALARNFLSLADEAKNLDAQLRLATAQTGSFAQATDDVRRIAETTRSGLAETADLYGTFTRNAAELGLTQAQAARATETFSKTLLISGAGAAESSAAIRQFSQALASGVLRGDEFNSIMENSPRLARLLADSLGVPVGALRKMAEEGQLTADKLTRALTDAKVTDGIDAEFKQLPVTFDQAMGQIHNAAVIVFGAFDRGGEFSTALANFITDGTGGFAELEAAATQMGVETRAVFEGLGDVFQPLYDGAIAAFSGIRGEVASTREAIASLLQSYDTLVNLVPNVGNAAKRFDNRVFGTNWQMDPLSDRAGVFRRSTAASATASRTKLLFSPDALARSLAEFGPRTATAAPRATATAGSGAKKGRAGPSADTVARREEAARVAEERRQQAFDNELAASNQDLLDARRALVNSAEIIAELDKQNIETERARYEDNLKSQVSQKKLSEAEAEKLRILNDQTAALKTQLVDQREAERIAEQQLDSALGELRNAEEIEQLAGQLANTREARKESELRLLDYQYQEEKLRLEYIRDLKNQDPKVRADAIRDLGALETKTGLKRDVIARQNESPLERYRREISGDFQSVNDQIENIEVQGLRALSDELTNAAKKALGLSGALGDVVGQLIQIGIQRAIIGPLADALFGAAGGGGGGILGSVIGSIFGGGRAAGGPVSSSKMYMVGEKGPELFVPGSNGTIVPQGKAIRPVGGAVAARPPTIVKQYSISVSADHSVTPAGFARGLAQQILQEAARMDAKTAHATMKAVPARMGQFQSDGT